MTDQISEQLNKRLDMVNEELERLRNKNSKLKNKVKTLKQIEKISTMLVSLQNKLFLLLLHVSHS